MSQLTCKRERFDHASHGAMLLAGFISCIATIWRSFLPGKLLCVPALLLVSAAGLQAATTVAQYRERIHNAVLVLNRLSAETETADGTPSEARVAAALAEVRALVPPTETVAASTGEWQVDNSWLHAALSEYEKAPVNPQRAEMLTRITDRLQALGVRLSELEDTRPTSAASKNRNKERLAEIMRRPEYQKKQAESSALAKLWQRILKWLSNLFPKSESISPESAGTVSWAAQVFVVGLALAVIAYVVWKLAPRFLRRSKSKKSGKRKARIVLGERLEPDQTAGDLLAEADLLARAGDLRAAIRKAYIALLCELGDRKIIRLAQHKTNRDYLRAVRQMAPLHDEMRQLTNSFESHWYGFVPATEIEWSTFRSGYHRALTGSL